MSIAKFGISAESVPKSLFLGFLESDVFPKLGRILLELDLALDFLSVLARPIGLASLFVLQLYELDLGHGDI
ncbi:MAG: hypothetical protein JWO00_612 [Candidatus Parcubacteria bacterium]|nr:hypothetical protein [Candidatus Parcubacteria bacterium]